MKLTSAVGLLSTYPAIRRSLGDFRGVLERLAVLALLVAAWEAVVLIVKPPAVLLPTPYEVLLAFVAGWSDGSLLGASVRTFTLILEGLTIGFVLALLLSIMATFWKPGRALMETLTSTFNPLPAIALLPIALLWFGVNPGAIVFVLVMSVTWPAAINIYAGFSTIPLTLQRVGHNFGLSGIALVARIYVPATLPHLLSALRVGWAFAWRTAIAAEMVFGIAGKQGGLGWFIYTNRYYMQTASVFAGLLTIIIVGLLVENGVFGSIERATIRKWGISR